MNAQPLTTPEMTCDFIVTLPVTNLPPKSPIYASSRDYGFDIDEEALARELIAPLPVSLENHPIPNVDANDFEQVFKYFLS